MRKSRFSAEQIIGLLERVEMGQALPDVCREYGVSDATYYWWKAQYGGLEVNQLRRLRPHRSVVRFRFRVRKHEERIRERLRTLPS
jgi:hypothetical protein